MIKKISDKLWFPFWIDKWIFGSMRVEFTPLERAIWIDLLALAAKDEGWIRANKETPYPLSQLAGMLIYSVDEFTKAIDKFVEKKKIKIEKNGTMKIINWKKYCGSTEYRKVLRHRYFEKNANKNDDFPLENDEKGVTEKVTGCYRKGYRVLPKRLQGVTEKVTEKLQGVTPSVSHNNKHNNKYNNKHKHNIKNRDIYNGRNSNDFDHIALEEFEKLWKEWPEEARFKKKTCWTKFLSLYKAGKLDEFKEAVRGYSEYLYHLRVNENFDQKPMHLSTFLNNWEQDKDKYIGFKYKPRL